MAVSADHRPILALSTARIPTRPVERRLRYDLYARRGDRLHRCQAVAAATGVGLQAPAKRTQLDLGDHPIGVELARADLGRAVLVALTPSRQMVLTGTLETWPVD